MRPALRPPAARVAALAVALALSAPAAWAAPATAAAAPAASAARATQIGSDRMSARFTDGAGTTSTYHLFTSRVATSSPRGLVVYLDGDGMYGHRNPSSTWALGGSRGVVAEAGRRGYATLSIHTPDRRGVPTFWEDGRTNAAYVDALVRQVRGELGVGPTWLVGYSGGSQLITRFLLPAHPGVMAYGGGAVITGGGGRPASAGALGTVSARTKAAFPLHWHTGALDDGRGTSDGYHALADARRGSASYAGRGFRVTRAEPAGVDHSGLGTRFGAVLGQRLDAEQARAAGRTR